VGDSLQTPRRPHADPPIRFFCRVAITQKGAKLP
jgi:hypothetical protein